MRYLMFASQAVIGVSFSKDKSQDLIRNSLRDMLRAHSPATDEGHATGGGNRATP